MVMVGKQGPFDTMRVQQSTRDPRILAGYEIGPAQDIERTQPDVRQIANRSGDQVERRLQRLRERLDRQSRYSTSNRSFVPSSRSRR